jgi:hypothetical protein
MISMLWKSIYDANAYAYALKNWRWKFALYFLFVCAVFTAVTTVPMMSRINDALFKDIDAVAAQIPEGVIKDGRFSMDVPSPHFVKLSNGQPFMAFSNELLDSRQTKGLLLSLEKDRITIYGPAGETYYFLAPNEELIALYLKEMFNIDSTDGIAVNGELFSKFVPFVKFGCYLVLPFLIFGIAALMMIMMALSLSVFVFVLSLTRLTTLGYLGAIKVSLLATTPAMLFFAVESVLGYGTSGGVIYMILSFVIVLRVMRRLSASQPSSDK